MSKLYQIANRIVRKSYWFNNVLFPNCRKFWTQRIYKLELINLGSSSGLRAFDYTGTGVSAANWAMAPQSFVGDYQILRNYYSYLKEGATILLPICPFSSLGGGNDFFPDYYYSILNIISIPNASYKKKMQVKNMFDNPIQYYPLAELLFSIKRFLKRHPQNGQEELIIDAKTRLLNWKKEFSIESFDDDLTILQRDLLDDSKEALNAIITFCKERRLNPVLVLPPISVPMREFFSDDIVKRYVIDFVSLVNKEGIPFLNHLKDARFDDYSLYRDSFLLNEKGARLFTSVILEELKHLS